jgi:hypothetical protein
MDEDYNRSGKGSAALAENFGKDSVDIAIYSGEWFRTHFSSSVKPGDMDLGWEIDKNGLAIYGGVALVRDGKVLYYDRYPHGGGPYQVKDFTDPTFRGRAELISADIEALLEENQENENN